MAAVNRRPLANRPLPLQIPSVFSPAKAARTVSAPFKRPRSPDLAGATASHPHPKRMRETAPSIAPPRDTNKERKYAEREQQKTEFKEKFTRAFPTWRFYLDRENMATDPSTIRSTESRIRQLGGTVEDFFSKEVSHLITNQPISTNVDSNSEKENVQKMKHLVGKGSHHLKSPIKLKGQQHNVIEEAGGHTFRLVSKAVDFGMKIWTTAKLESVLTRCIDAPSTSGIPHATPAHSSAAIGPQRSLSRLLQSERIHGTTERDPTQKRHDFHYFTRGSRFVLVEDLRQELATIAAHEYIIKKGRDENTTPPWPVLHCHPQSRGPFIPFDERERKRWERLQQADNTQNDERAKRRDRIMKVEAVKRKTEFRQARKCSGDLRRSVSMNNLRRRASYPVAGTQGTALIDLDADADNPDSANASGYLASGATGYVAASGNSVGITSTTGTTSTTGYTSRKLQLPAALSGRIKQQVMTSMKFSTATGTKTLSEQKTGAMGPPAVVPERQPLLRKSKSTNTLKLPKRDEGSKPGYCESCRMKFDDFKAHITGRKHRRFALDDANFLQLDCVLARVQRRTLAEVQQEQIKREERRKAYCNGRYSCSPFSGDNDDTGLMGDENPVSL